MIFTVSNLVIKQPFVLLDIVDGYRREKLPERIECPSKPTRTTGNTVVGKSWNSHIQRAILSAHAIQIDDLTFIGIFSKEWFGYYIAISVLYCLKLWNCSRYTPANSTNQFSLATRSSTKRASLPHCISRLEPQIQLHHCKKSRRKVKEKATLAVRKVGVNYG